MGIPFEPPQTEGEVRTRLEAARGPAGLGRWVLAATIIGSSMSFIDGTAITVVLPVLQTELKATVAGVQWVVEAYTLFLAALILVGGALGDRFGRRRVFAVGVALFAAASASTWENRPSPTNAIFTLLPITSLLFQIR